MVAITTWSDFEAPQISRGAIKNIQQLGVGVLLLCQVWRKGWGGPGGVAGWPGQAREDGVGEKDYAPTPYGRCGRSGYPDEDQFVIT